MNLASPSPEVMPHETLRFVRHHPLALHFVPRSYLRCGWNHEQHPSALRIHSKGHNQREPLSGDRETNGTGARCLVIERSEISSHRNG
jgi:hypothetical protein